jgi:hypothetical protein
MFSPTSNLRPAPSTWRAAVRRAVDLTVAFATLESATSARDLIPHREDPARSSACPHGPIDTPTSSPHRAPLRAPLRPGRSGTVPARAQYCLTPHTGLSRHRSAHHPSAH